jgi:hypothetical protein
MWSGTALQHHKEELVHVTKINFVFQRNGCKKVNGKNGSYFPVL